MARKPTDTVGLQLRFSEQLRRKIEQAAKKNDRSMNQEIVARLEQTFAEPVLLERIDAAVKSAVSFIAKKEGE